MARGLQTLVVALALAAASGFGFAPSRAVAPPRARALRAEGDESVEAAPEEEAVAEAPMAVEAVAAAPEEDAPAAAVGDDEAKPSEIARQKRKDKANAMPLDKLVVGESYAGTITGVAQYGAFVDVGATSDGLVHISELSTDYVEEVASVATVGDSVTVRVLKLDLEKKQLSLSMKPEGAAPPPAKRRGGRPKKAGADELRKYADADPAEFVNGVVRTVLQWGAFVNIAEGVDGLVHISRVSDARVDDLEAALSVGDEVKVRVIGVDLEKATVALAMNTYRDPTAPPRPGERDDGPRENARARRARDPDQQGGRGGQRRPSRRDPGDDIWDSKDAYDWKDVVQTVEYDEDDLASGVSVDLETGKLTLQ